MFFFWTNWVIWFLKSGLWCGVAFKLNRFARQLYWEQSKLLYFTYFNLVFLPRGYVIFLRKNTDTDELCILVEFAHLFFSDLCGVETFYLSLCWRAHIFWYLRACIIEVVWIFYTRNFTIIVNGPVSSLVPRSHCSAASGRPPVLLNSSYGGIQLSQQCF